MDYILFWKPDQQNGVFSQWYSSTFKDDHGMLYNCAEQYMMAQKALLFNDINVYNKIMNIADARIIKKLGKSVKNFENNIWLKNRYQIIVNGNMLKFSQNKELKKILLLTGDKTIAEASPFDDIYGIGMFASKVTIDQWKGQNLLGKALMDVRNKLKK